MTDSMTKTRVYQFRPDPRSESRSWAWRCEPCGLIGFSCLHTELHPQGTWQAVFCHAFRHVHVEHPRPVDSQVWQHRLLGGRPRCAITRPTPGQVVLAERILGEMGPVTIAKNSYDRQNVRQLAADLQDAREFAAEILCFDGPWAQP